MNEDDRLGWDLEERDQFMAEFGDRDDIEPETTILVEANE